MNRVSARVSIAARPLECADAFSVYLLGKLKIMREIFRSSATWKWLLVGLGLVALVIAARAFPLLDWVKSLAQWAQGFGTAGALIYGIVFGLISVLMVPCLPLTIMAGFTFGMFNGLLAVIFGISLGAAGGFLFARYLARGAVAEKSRGIRASARSTKPSLATAGRSSACSGCAPCRSA